MTAAAEWSGMMLAALPVGVEGTAVAQYLADSSMLGELPCTIDTIHVATAVRMDGFESKLFDDDRLVIAGATDDDEVLDARSTGVVQARLLREAAHVLMLPMLAADSAVLSSGQDAAENQRVCAIVAALADPAAIIHLDAHCVDLRLLTGDVRASSRVRV